MRRIIFSVLVIVSCISFGFAQEQKNPQEVQRGIMKYFYRIFEIPADTIAQGDSASIILEFSLDCTNHITRYETSFDTSEGRSHLIISVYGTYDNSPYRPLCAAVLVQKEFHVYCQLAGDWIVEGGINEDEDSEPFVLSVR